MSSSGRGKGAEAVSGASASESADPAAAAGQPGAASAAGGGPQEGAVAWPSPPTWESKSTTAPSHPVASGHSAGFDTPAVAAAAAKSESGVAAAALQIAQGHKEPSQAADSAGNVAQHRGFQYDPSNAELDGSMHVLAAETSLSAEQAALVAGTTPQAPQKFVLLENVPQVTPPEYESGSCMHLPDPVQLRNLPLRKAAFFSLAAACPGSGCAEGLPAV